MFLDSYTYACYKQAAIVIVNHSHFHLPRSTGELIGCDPAYEDVWKGAIHARMPPCLHLPMCTLQLQTFWWAFQKILPYMH